MIYFMRSGSSDLVKIGWTASRDSLAVRKWSLQTGQPWKLEVIRVVDPGPRWMERWFHHEFRHLRTTGEWFVYTPAMLDVSPDPSVTLFADPLPSSARAAIEDVIERLVDLLDYVTPDPDHEQDDVDSEPEAEAVARVRMDDPEVVKRYVWDDPDFEPDNDAELSRVELEDALEHERLPEGC